MKKKLSKIRPYRSSGFPTQNRKKKITLSISKSTIQNIDEVRGKISRSGYIKSLIQPNISDDIIFNRNKKFMKRNGVVYTPHNLAYYVADKVMEYFFEVFKLEGKIDRTDNIYIRSYFEKIRIIDPACGQGELLEAGYKALIKGVEINLKDKKYVESIKPNKILCGLDINQNAIRNTKKRIISLSANSSKKDKFNLIKTNALFPFNKKSNYLGWNMIKNRFQAKEGFDIVIANPPWGASIETYKTKLLNGNFKLFKGQFDSSDLFLELSLSILKPGGLIAFIIPDSLFNKERENLRYMLLNQTEIKYIGRYGEKIFEGINRGCSVIICRKVKSSDSHEVECLRLTPELRKGILQGEFTFQDVEKLLVHKVLQSRFLNNKGFLFDIDIKKNEQQIIKAIKDTNLYFRNFLFNSRGVEISKSGKICKCNHCGLWLPYPNAYSPRCPHCKSNISISNLESTVIINSEPMEGYEKLLVGENIKRYFISSLYWIETNRKGIKYKDRSIYDGPKIVVRKTGVGLTATIDYENALTNQVVYIFKHRSNDKSNIPLELFLAIINSRAIYYYLVKNHGETEWRSHPYLTQTQILDLPLPKDLLSWQKLSKVDQITNLLKQSIMKNIGIPPEIDAQIEYLVANLFNLSKKDYNFIYSTLDEVEELLPVKALKKISIQDIFKN